MNDKITINGKEYDIPQFGFFALKEIGKLGLKPTQLDDDYEVYSYIVAYTIKKSKEEAEKEIDEHILKCGGSLEDFSDLVGAYTNAFTRNQKTMTIRK